MDELRIPREIYLKLSGIEVFCYLKRPHSIT